MYFTPGSAIEQLERAAFEKKRQDKLVDHPEKYHFFANSLATDKDFFITNWSEYRMAMTLSLWQAVCIANGINYKHPGAAIDGTVRKTVQYAEGDFGIDLQRLLSTFDDASISTGLTVLKGKVELIEFANWALRRHVQVHPKFAELCNLGPMHMDVPSKAEPERPAELLKKSDVEATSVVRHSTKTRVWARTQASQSAAEQEAAPALEVTALVASDKDGPQPLTTRDMAESFSGLHWDGAHWLKKLGNKPKWLDACLVLGGARGEGMRRWNPVLIGAYLVKMGHVKTNSVRAKFQTQGALKPWLDAWKTYEADNWPAG